MKNMKKTVDLVVPEKCYSMVDCWEAIMTMILIHFDKEPSVIYSGLDFYYETSKEEQESKSLENIFYNTFSLTDLTIVKQTLQFYEMYFSLAIQVEKSETVDEMYNSIKQELQDNKPVVVFVDTILCKFNRMYQKFSYSHAIIISGVDDGECLVLDPTQNLEPLKIGIEEVFACSTALLTFNNKDKYTVDGKELLKQTFERNNTRSATRKTTRIENIKNLFDAISNNVEIVSQSFDNKEESLNTMFAWLFKNTSINIKNYTLFVQKNYSNAADIVSVLLKECQEKWMILGKIFMRMYYSSKKLRDEQFKKISLLFDDIYNLEQKIMKELIILFNLNSSESGEII